MKCRWTCQTWSKYLQ